MVARKATFQVPKGTRKLIVDALVNNGLDQTTAVNYEKSIHSVSKSISAYTSLAYEKVGEILSGNPKIAIENTDQWSSCVYEKEREKYETSVLQSNVKIKPVKGLYKCKNRKCGSDEFYITLEQRRGGDEGMTTVRQCARCGKRGTES